MATNAERQAEFKARMREQGKRQLTVWATPKQAKAIKAYLEGEPLPVTPKLEPGKAPKPQLPKTKTAGKITTRLGQQEGETQVWRDGKQIGRIYKRRIDSYPKPITRWEAFKYSRIRPLGKYRTKREAVDALIG